MFKNEHHKDSLLYKQRYLFIPHLVDQRANVLNFDIDLITILQHNSGLPGEANSSRSARQEDCASFQGRALR